MRDPESGQYHGLPDQTYHLNGYEYKTDANGNIASVFGTLTLKDGERKAINDRVADAAPGDERGHLIGDIFNGSNLSGNLIAMSFDLNRVKYRELERKWEEALKAKPPKEVRVYINPVYGENGGRPDGIEIVDSIDGELSYVFLENDAEKAQP